MWIFLRAKIPTEAGNKMVEHGQYIDKAKPEASYFFEADLEIVASFNVDIQSADQIPELAGLLLFQEMCANVEFHPVMSFDDLKKAISKMS